MFTVSLKAARFTAYIGLYPQEEILPNQIEIDIAVSTPAHIDDLPMIDYTELHAVASAAVSEPTGLLETVLQRIVTAIQNSFPGYRLEVAVRKLHPPMGAQVAHCEVKWTS